LSGNIEHETCKFIIANFCVDPQKITYIHQLKQAKKLYALFPDPSFWKWIVRNESEYKVYTLVHYLKPDKIKYLKELKSVKEFSIKKNDKIEIEEEKQGEDKQVKRKPRNLLDFLRNG
jgi:16S rRNA G966 N2-methylase RsmD